MGNTLMLKSVGVPINQLLHLHLTSDIAVGGHVKKLVKNWQILKIRQKIGSEKKTKVMLTYIIPM